jgi:hypothetical protein
MIPANTIRVKYLWLGKIKTSCFHVVFGKLVKTRCPEHPSFFQIMMHKFNIKNAASWFKAEASALVRELPADQYQARLSVCRSCEFLDARQDPQVGFCKACGCGENARAELTIKGKMPAATCPRGKWTVVP